eukprot:TRINITY_DN4632_c0_g1_i2.p1 TRINITY_DN4632_c0_g1~~TRINITY_DN4632_c0_g1_i2.p1  ORF type:complete len:150 (+),score=27.44 TRINITY_DN4632_c0_g1_i2:82-531(+)
MCIRDRQIISQSFKANPENSIEQDMKNLVITLLPKAMRKESIIQQTLSSIKNLERKIKPEHIGVSIHYSKDFIEFLKGCAGKPSESSEERKGSAYCEDCIRGLNAKARLSCGHSVCKNCLALFALKEFLLKGSYAVSYTHLTLPTICSV